MLPINRRLVMTGALSSGLAALCTPSEAADGGEAPFGLVWGSSEAQVRAAGVVLTPSTDAEYGVSFSATRLPKAISDLQSVDLAFGYNDRLWRIVAVSKEFDNDPYGSAVLLRYDELVAALRKKYGQGAQTHQQDTEMWKGADEFLMGIKQGRSWHYTIFKMGSISVEISVRALSSDTGIIVLIYVDRDLESEFKKKKGSAEENAL